MMAASLTFLMVEAMNEMNTQITSCIFIIVDERFRLTESGIHDHSRYAIAMGNHG